jgi:hypothetical protein
MCFNLLKNTYNLILIIDASMSEKSYNFISQIYNNAIFDN